MGIDAVSGGWRLMRARKLAVLALLVVVFSCLGCQGKRSPVDGRVRVIYCGDPTQNPSPYPFMRSEPLLDVLPIACLLYTSDAADE